MASSRLTNYEREAKGILRACSTSKRLLDVWPEVADWFEPKTANSSPSLLPVVPIKDLNERVSKLRAG